MLDKIKLIPSNSTLTKEEIKYKECRFDYLIVECRNSAKRKEFIQVVHSLDDGEGVEVMTMAAFLKEKKAVIEKVLRADDR